MIRSFFFALFVLSFFASCSKNSTNGQVTGGDFFGIFSTRPSNHTVIVTTVKLKSPALFAEVENAMDANGKKKPLSVSKDQEKVIEQEQAAAIAEMAKISAEIKVIYKFKYVLNALVIQSPTELYEKIRQISGVMKVEASPKFSAPLVEKTAVLSNVVSDFSRNSVIFIGADKARGKGVTGLGVKVGVIDTGVDYTHAMLGGSGDPAQFKNMDKSKASPFFPNQKVVGGYDFVGTKFDSNSEDMARQIPIGDENPMDEGGHGTHVAGSVAGLGDDVNTYSGVAPEASIYALKVFGESGSTNDAVVIAAFEWAADPNKDGKFDDKLDVVNLSLGSGYGNPHILYGEAIRNLTQSGTVVVASAGNSGPQDFIVGAPSASTEALSVAAGIDDSFHNWQFSSSEFYIGNERVVVEAIEGTITKAIAEFESAQGSLVYAGLATEDFNEELTAKVKGKVALIDRGIVPFADKVQRAFNAGAVGVVVANNQPGNPIAMGGSGKFAIPGIMINIDVANKIKEALKTTEVVVNFKGADKILKPELIDTITDFSSKGPRSMDSALKPEITGPGSQIISAAMGEGTKAVKMSGTSMSAPHLAGVMALMKQKFSTLSANELKSMVMGTSLKISEKGKEYPLSRQGAGRVRADVALDSVLASSMPAVSLKAVGVNTRKKMSVELPLHNLTGNAMNLRLAWKGSANLKFEFPENISLAAQAEALLNAKVTIDATTITSTYAELDGHIQVLNGEQVIFQWPVLAVAYRLSAIESSSLQINSFSEVDAFGALTELTLTNKSSNPGDVLVFNLLASDKRKKFVDEFTSRDCDLQAAGYRVIKKDGKDVLQVAVKTYRNMTTWNSCEVSVLIDSDGDSVPDQEIVGVPASSVPGGATSANFVSYLLDAKAAKALRLKFEKAIAENPKATQNYAAAIQDINPMKVYNNSTVAIVEAPMEALNKNPMGELQLSVLLAQSETSTVEDDDYLSKSMKHPFRLAIKAENQPYANLKDALAFTGTKTLEFTRGAGNTQLLVLTPMNAFRTDETGLDNQATILKPSYKAP